MQNDISFTDRVRTHGPMAFIDWTVETSKSTPEFFLKVMFSMVAQFFLAVPLAIAFFYLQYEGNKKAKLTIYQGRSEKGIMIKVGKKYIARNGEVVEIVKELDRSLFYYPFEASNGYAFMSNGRSYDDKYETENDLIQEFKDNKHKGQE